jgi:sugar lactone lactonase YvrE
VVRGVFAMLLRSRFGSLASSLTGLFGLAALGGALAGCGSESGTGPDTPSLPDAGPDAPPPPPPPPPPVEVKCDNEALSAGCKVGRCTLTSAGGPLPPGETIALSERPAPEALVPDVLVPVLCGVDLPRGARPSGLTLSIALDGPAPARAALFTYAEGRSSRALALSAGVGDSVSGVLDGSGEFGATARPGEWGIEGFGGQDVSSSADQASLLRNLSSQYTASAFFDGTNLFVGNGARVLVYDGIPARPDVRPRHVLGQPSLDRELRGTTSAQFGTAGAGGIWSDGTRLAVSNGNRVLIWLKLPDRDLAPADLVLGQADFSSNEANAGGVSAASFSFASGIASDGTRLLVADMRNNRVLEWRTFPTAVGQGADFVLGQPTFASNGISVGAAAMYQPWQVALAGGDTYVATVFSSTGAFRIGPFAGSNPPIASVVYPRESQAEAGKVVGASGVAITAAGGLAVRDGSAARILMTRALPSGAGSADYVLGQWDAIHLVVQPVSASSVATGNLHVHRAGDGLLVPDGRRVLVYDTTPTYTFEPASRVVGQAGFTTNDRVDYRQTSASTLAEPADVALSGAITAVADRSNNRVLLYRGALAAASTAASVVLGQTDARSYIPNVDQTKPGASTLSGPAAVALDGTHLIVADTENHRVLIWNSVPTTNGAPADVVLGQADFQGRRPNRGRGDVSPADGYSDADADGFFYPSGVASDGTHLFVADTLNHRVLVWDTFPTQNGTPASRVLGQPTFASVGINRGAGPFVFRADGFQGPTGLTLDGNTLYVADTQNNRVVRYEDVFAAATPTAFVGQASGTAVANSNYNMNPPNRGLVANPGPQATATAVVRPRGVAVSGGRLFVSELGANRVHVFDKSTLAHQHVLGQASPTTGAANASGVGPASLSAPAGLGVSGTDLFVADSANHRVLGYPLAAITADGVAATRVLGQSSLFGGGFNASSTASGGATSRPRGIARHRDAVYVADTGNHRVLVLAANAQPGTSPVRVFGQPDDALAIPNSGGAPSARSMNAPRGVFVDDRYVMVADTGNHRVLVFDRTSTSPDAVRVLGQPTFASASVNAGGASAATMSAPSDVFFDGTKLYVADTGNSRVLVWNQLPTSNGQAADVVLGQVAPDATLANRGTGDARADTLAFPGSIAVLDGALYVADTGNNRVLRFGTVPASNGAAADGVLGQPSLETRVPAAFAADKNRLAGPVDLATDGENLFVADRDLGRVLVYGREDARRGEPAQQILGGTGGALTLSGVGGVAVERGPLFSTRVYITEPTGDRFVVVSPLSRLVTN